MAATDPVTPPPPHRAETPKVAKLLFPVVPQSAATVPLPSLVQREHDSSRENNSCCVMNISDLTRICLRRRVQKIYDMSTDVIEGYGTYYYDKHGKPLPQDTVDKIMLLYHNRIEHRCNEVGLSVKEEEQWDPEDTNINVDALSDSGEESEEHDSNDVIFYSDMDANSNDEDDNNADADDFTGTKGKGSLRGFQIPKLF
jgi:hypothetical protein